MSSGTTRRSGWDTPAFDLPPTARSVGPFVSPTFLATWDTHFGDQHGTTQVVESDDALIVLSVGDDRLAFAGHDDVTDYHSPLGAGADQLVADVVADAANGTSVSFDSLPSEAADVVIAGVAAAGLRPTQTQHEVAPVIELADDFETYLAGLDKKQRHEIRRKRRRFEEKLGPATLERRSGSSAAQLFADMHRAAAGEKGTFMDDRMEAFFAALHTEAGAMVDVLVAGEGLEAAATFGFEDSDTYYLYNSAYDPAIADVSPGIVLLEMVIRRTIASGRARLDFLKGDEVYKYRLGAVARPLYLVTAEVGARG